MTKRQMMWNLKNAVSLVVVVTTAAVGFLVAFAAATILAEPFGVVLSPGVSEFFAHFSLIPGVIVGGLVYQRVSRGWWIRF